MAKKQHSDLGGEFFLHCEPLDVGHRTSIAVSHIIALVSKLSDGERKELWQHLVRVDEKAPFKETVENLMNAAGQLAFQAGTEAATKLLSDQLDAHRITLTEFRAYLEKSAAEHIATLKEFKQHATVAFVERIRSKAQLRRRSKCAQVKHARVQKRHSAIAAAKAAGIADEDVYKHMLREHDDLMQTGKRRISEESMWKKYKRQKRAGQLQSSGTNAIIPPKMD